MRAYKEVPKACIDFKRKRISLQMTQQDLAEKMGMYQSNISRIERGEREPTKIQIHFLDSLVGLES